MYIRFPEYSRIITLALINTPGGKLNTEDLRKAAGFQKGVLLPVLVQMEQEGTVQCDIDRTAAPPVHVYSLTEKGRAL